MMIVKFFIVYVAAICSLTACNKDTVQVNPDSIDPVVNTLNDSTAIDVAYGTDPLQKLDFYLPANRNAQTRILVLVHGGAWSGGDKSEFYYSMDSLKSVFAGYCIFNINYRLASPPANNVFPTQEMDVKSAIQYIYNKKDVLHYGTTTVLLGGSAGGHLVLLQAYKYTSPLQVKMVVDYYGPTDMSGMYNFYAANNPSQIPNFLGLMSGSPTSNPTSYASSSPITYVSSQSPPTLIFHGDKDSVVPIAQSYLLRDSLLAKGAIVQLKVYTNEGHGWANPFIWLDNLARIRAFKAQYLP